MKRRSRVFISAVIGACLSSTAVIAQEKPAPADAAEVAKKLSNTVASFISVPFQDNTEVGIGSQNGSKNTLNIQPVIPLKLSSRLNLIGRIVLPVFN